MRHASQYRAGRVEAMNVTPHFVVPDAAEAAAWYARAFGAVELSRVPLPNGAVMTVALRIGDSELHIASEFPDAGILSPISIGGTATVLQITTDDADALWEQALAADATVLHPIADQFWGDRQGQLTDPFGHRWNIAQHIRDLSPDEIAAAAAERFGG
jgi:PhnB protein